MILIDDPKPYMISGHQSSSSTSINSTVSSSSPSLVSFCLWSRRRP